MRLRLVAAPSAALVWAALLAPRPADAQDKPTLAGTWSASALKETWSTKEWGEDCGPKPTSSGGAPGGTVTVTPQGGDLAFAGAGRGFSTAECWERLPGLKRTAHSGGARGWSNKCASPAGDPRRASISNSFTATDDTIVFQETGVFEFAIKDSVCKASVSRSRTYKLQQRAGEAPPPEPTAAPTATATAAPAPTPTPAPPEPETGCDKPGPPARLEVRPAKKLLRPGESFSLAVRVSDKSGCKLTVDPEMKLAEGGEPKLVIDGLKITADAASPTGTRKIEATVAGKTVTVEVEVANADRYAELLQLRGLNAAGEDDRASVAEIAAGLGGTALTAEDSAGARKRTFIAIVGGVAGILGIVGLAIWRRGRGRRDDEAERESEAPPPNVTLFDGTKHKVLGCPRCGREYPGDTGFCEDDGAGLIPIATPSSRGTSLTPAAPPSSTSAAPVSKVPEKICPTCGDRFPADSGFCGKDGTQLVPVN
ncbi:MAG: hypothetical protein HOV80_25440 [Polyangiaceae bacterium]|nr:hypothetical protein [Polyangiaceae bacterium]